MSSQSKRLMTALVLCTSGWAGVAFAQESAAAGPGDEAATSAEGAPEAGAAASATTTLSAERAAAPEASVAVTSAAPVEPEAEQQADNAETAALEAMLAQNMMEQSKAPKLEFYGFADFTYRQFTVSKKNSWRDAFPDDGAPQFMAGNLNLYMRGNLAENWTSLAEVRFHFSPAGNQLPETEAIQDPTRPHYRSNTALDPVEFGRSFSYGFIEVERLHIDYTPYSFLKFRAGRFLTPYGVWNVDHGSPVIIDVTRPYIIGDALLPEHQTGFEIHGSFASSTLEYGYHVTLSNGRGPIEQIGDLDRNKGIGGRLWLRSNTPVEVTWGASGYYGTYTDRRFILEDVTTQKVGWSDWEKYRELGLATDLRLRYRGLHWISEAVAQQRAWDDDKRGTPGMGASVTPGSRTADVVRWGAYSLLGWRFDWYGVMPFALFQFYNPGLRDALVGGTHLYAVNAGVNVRVVPSVVLKASMSATFMQGIPDGSPMSEPLYLAAGQVAWAF